jgi:hypothetical protein
VRLAALPSATLVALLERFIPEGAVVPDPLEPSETRLLLERPRRRPRREADRWSRWTEDDEQEQQAS